MELMNVLVEDNASIFPYQLLNGVYGNKIKGCCGNYNVSKEICGEFAENTIIYLDTCADNRTTIRLYNDVVDKTRNLSSVFVVPIPCIEYIFIRSFIGYSTVEATTAIKFENYTKCIYNYRRKALVTRAGFEHFCKSVVANHFDCYKNDMYVTEDCLCRKPVRNICDTLPLDNKRKRLMYSLPITNAVMKKYMYTRDATILRDVIAQCECFYEQQRINFINYGFVDPSDDSLKLHSQFN